MPRPSGPLDEISMRGSRGDSPLRAGISAVKISARLDEFYISMEQVSRSLAESQQAQLQTLRDSFQELRVQLGLSRSSEDLNGCGSNSASVVSPHTTNWSSRAASISQKSSRTASVASALPEGTGISSTGSSKALAASEPPLMLEQNSHRIGRLGAVTRVSSAPDGVSDGTYFELSLEQRNIRPHSEVIGEPSVSSDGAIGRRAVRASFDHDNSISNPIYQAALKRKWRSLVKSLLRSYEKQQELLQQQRMRLRIRDAWLPHRTFDTIQLGTSETFDDHSPMWGGVLVGDVIKGNSCFQRFIMRPDTWFRVFWVMLAAALILQDVLLIPLGFFDLRTATPMTALSWLSILFWTCDIFVGLITGYHHEGIVEMRPSRVVAHYLRGWFLIDATVVFLDWFLLDYSSSATADLVNNGKADTVGYARIGKHTFRMSRIVRTIRLLRLRKGARALRWSFSFISSEQAIIILKLVLYVLAILVVNHYIACAFYALSSARVDFMHSYDPDHQCTWLSRVDLEDASIPHQYLAGLHWSLTQFTPATNNIVPCNIEERLFACCVVIFALVTFSTFVGGITGSMAKLAALNGMRQQEENQVSEFLASRQLSQELGHRIWYFYRKSTKRTGRVKEVDVPFFAKLPATLKIRLRTEMFARDLIHHPLWAELAESNMPLISAMCTSVIVETSYMSGEDIFMYRDRATHALIPVQGELSYFKPTEHGSRQVPLRTLVSECALWADWYHRGRLEPQTPTETLTVCISKWEALFSNSQVEVSTCFPGIASYVADFVKLANDSIDGGTLVDDLFGMFNELEALQENSRTAFMSMEFSRKAKVTFMRSSRVLPAVGTGVATAGGAVERLKTTPQKISQTLGGTWRYTLRRVSSAINLVGTGSSKSSPDSEPSSARSSRAPVLFGWDSYVDHHQQMNPNAVYALSISEADGGTVQSAHSQSQREELPKEAGILEISEEAVSQDIIVATNAANEENAISRSEL